MSKAELLDPITTARLPSYAAGPAGLTARGLSEAVFGDAEHIVTVRAEVSRLRRSIGALVSTNPYRLADGVTLTRG